ERSLHHFGKIDEGEDGPVEIGEMRGEGSTFLGGERLHGGYLSAAVRAREAHSPSRLSRHSPSSSRAGAPSRTNRRTDTRRNAGGRQPAGARRYRRAGPPRGNS